MSKTDPDELEWFKKTVAVDRRIHSDTHESAPPQQRHKNQQQLRKTTSRDKQNAATFAFSESFQAHFPEGPLRFVAAGEDPYLPKQLRRGDYSPELLLDLHGLTQQQAREEVAALLIACQKQHVDCCSIMHGHGNGILKQNLPHWLVQHPLVRAFHQAPQAWGGDAALLILVRTD